MRVRGRVAAAVAAAGIVAGGAGVAAAEIDPGRAAFLQYCASCHGPRAAGDGPMAAELRERPADLRKLGAKYGMPLPRPKLVEIVDGREMVRAHGSREMPVWGRTLLENVPPGSGTEAWKRGTILSILNWLDSVQQP